MAEISLFWGGSSTGDCGPYTDDQFSDAFCRAFQTDRTTQGPLLDQLNELEVTNPAGLTIRVATGWAIVDGKFYRNDANIDTVISSPGALRYYRVVLRKNFTAQTVRVAILGPDAGSTPAVTQDDGTTWEVPLASFTIDGSDNVTITDEREFCSFAHNPPARTRQFMPPVDYFSGMINDAKSSNGFGFITENAENAYLYGSFMVPENYVSGMRVYGLYVANSVSILNYTLALILTANGASTVEGPNSDTTDLDTGVVYRAVTRYNQYRNVYLDLPNVSAGDLIQVVFGRLGTDPLDTGDASFACQMTGFLVTYQASD